MEIRRFFSEALSPEGGLCELDKAQSHHIINVLRLKPGKEIEIFDGKGCVARARIEISGKTKVACRIIERNFSGRKQEAVFAVALGLIKDKRMRFALEKLSEIGVGGFYPVICARSVPFFKDDEDRGKKSGKWGKIAVESAKQCQRNTCMSVYEISTLEQFLEVSNSFRNKYFADAEAGDYLSGRLPGTAGSSICLIGPEGGFSAGEKEKLLEKSFCPVRLGVNVLRSETAAVYAGILLADFYFKE
ncbi:MAG: 16S rRNA (uracil(1498)-N(3))-methyltransferase [Candidatus Aureabacteria bacterium]|nr:16S rRNA (uracil(1498)-N(3))-methyltransferase [Candidatus Auribacterota bacterium]